MDFRIEPIGRNSFVKIISKKYLGDHHLQFQCFENFLEFGLAAEVYEWEIENSKASYSLTTTGKKKGKVKLDVTVYPVDDGIVMDTAVTNLDTHIVDHILYNTCLQSKDVPFFQDDEGERTFVRVENEWRSIANMPVTAGPGRGKRMQNFYVKDHKPDAPPEVFMGQWGTGLIPLSRAFMAKTSSESNLTMGIMWDRAFYARANRNRSHDCIHSQAVLDDISPGETRKRIGKIFFTHEGLDQLYENAKEFFSWKE